MHQLPFKMITETSAEKYRFDTFWSKEPETIAWIDSFADDAVFYDVGANIGIYSLYCAAKHQKSIVVAFEPHPGNRMRLVANAVKNGFSDRIIYYGAMVSDKYEQADFAIASDEIGSSGSQMCAGKGDWTITIDSVVLYSFDAPFPDHIKIDIDGQELKVINGMLETMDGPQLKSILIEATPQDKPEIIKILSGKGFATDNRFNAMTPHSRERRERERIDVENIVFVRS